ncbi:hypothetical protein AAZX31_09G105100 [Glycine max]
MRHVTSQQAANHRGQRQLNETFYCYNMHQQSQDPSPFPWPTPEKFEATVAWPRDETNFEMQVGPARTSGGGTKPRRIRTWLTCWTSSCEDSELYGRVAKFVICFHLDIIAFGYFVISVVI